MTNTAILAASALLLFAYLLDILGRRFRLPSVVLLIVTGLVARHVLDRMGFAFEGIDPIVPIVGTIGLILIVLEGALDLEVSADRARTIAKAGASAVIGVALCTLAFAALFHFALGYAPYLSVLAAIPFAVISSAVAIPSTAGLAVAPREFVIYESSLSDIVGVLVFFAALVSKGNPAAFALELFGGGALSIVVALAASLGLYAIVNKADGHVRFLPMLAGLVCLYAIGKALYLSPLVFVLVAGLVIGNPHLLDRWPRLKRLHSPDYDQTVREFKGVVAELTFATKSLFFLLLGYWTDVAALLEPRAWGIAAACVGFIFASRRLMLRFAPRRRRRVADLDRAARAHHGAAVRDRGGDRRVRHVPVRGADADRARHLVARGARAPRPRRAGVNAPGPGHRRPRREGAGRARGGRAPPD